MKLAVIALLLLPVCAQAQVYKCVAPDGSTSYATVPCPEGAGETTRIIEPVPPSGALNIPYSEQTQTEEDAPADAEDKPSATTVTGIPDSEESRRAQKKEQIREDELQHKRDLYDEALRKRERLDAQPVKQPTWR